MLVRNFQKPIHSIDDINNIPERRRFVIVFKYPDGPHRTMFEIYQNSIYDLYIINTSTLIGTDYIIPKNFVLQYKNTYRGKVINPFNLDGSFNLQSVCIFNTCSFSTRIVDGLDVIRFSKKDTLSDSTWENYIANLLKSDTIIPLPTYYNIEDQARLAKSEFQNVDFENYLNTTPEYTLNDFRDAKTVFISLEVHEDKLFNNCEHVQGVFKRGNDLHTPEETKWFLEVLRDNFISVFLDCYNVILESIFAQAYITVELESGLFSVDTKTLTLKHSYNVTKEEIKKEYGFVIQELDDLLEQLDGLSADYMNDCFYQFEIIPTRILIYISPTLCRFKLLYHDEKIFKILKNINTATEYSSSDTEESFFAREFGESMHLDYYDYHDDIPF
jgi:hypothetical protein